MESRDRWMVLSGKAIISIFIYDIVLFLTGTILSMLILFKTSNPQFNENITITALLGSIGTGLLGNSINYIRKIYKSCIQQRISKPDSTENGDIQMIGTIIYFIFRPLFAIAFVILIVIGLNAGFLSVSVKGNELSNGFINVCMFLSFFIGFSTGSFLNIIEVKGQQIIGSLFSGNDYKEKNNEHNQ